MDKISDKKRKKYGRLTLEKRKILEQRLKQGIPQKEIAAELGVTMHTIYYELRKNQMTCCTYNAEEAQKYLIKRRKARC